MSTVSIVKLSEINFWILKIEDTALPGNVGIRFPVSLRHVAEELNPCCLIFIICGVYMDNIRWSEIWYFCCRDVMESKKALPFVKGFQTQNVRGKNGDSTIRHPGNGKILFLTVTLQFWSFTGMPVSLKVVFKGHNWQ